MFVIIKIGIVYSFHLPPTLASAAVAYDAHVNDLSILLEESLQLFLRRL